MRWGRWLSGLSVVMAYLTNAPPEALSAMAGYGFKQGEALGTAYWSKRFMFELTPTMNNALAKYLYPFLEQLEGRVAAMPRHGSERRMMAEGSPEVVRFLAKVAVQDSFAMLAAQPDVVQHNPVVAYLNQNPLWRHLAAVYLRMDRDGVSSQLMQLVVKGGYGCRLGRKLLPML